MCLPVVLLSPLRVTEVAEVVVPAQVFEQLVVVQVALVAELAEGVAPVGGVIRVPVDPVPGQVLPGIPFPLVGEDLQRQILYQYICIARFVLFPMGTELNGTSQAVATCKGGRFASKRLSLTINT